MLTGRISGSESRGVAVIDRSTHGIVNIEYEHHEIHAGDSYSCVVTDTNLGENGRHVISFKTPNTNKHIHMVAEAIATGEAEWKFYEGMTVTDNTGTTLPVYNRDRNSGNTSGVLDTSENPDLAGYATLDAGMGSGSAYGTVIEHIAMGVGKKVGGEARGIDEWILKPNTVYAFSLVSRAATNRVHIHLDWYEHTAMGTPG